jgi:hypothetical protein
MQNQPNKSQIRRLLSDLEIACLSQDIPPLERFKHMVDLYEQEQSALHEQVRNHEALPIVKRRFPPLFSL